MRTSLNHTKIIATIGPASARKDVLVKMMKAGMDVCRINFSHGTHADHQKVINTVRKINAEYQTNLCILGDLQGPKIRIGQVKGNEVWLKRGDEINITTRKQLSDEHTLYITYQRFPKDVSPDELILLDDGKLQLKIIETNKKNLVKARVIFGGKLSSNKGVNLPNTKISCPSLTRKDLHDLEFILKNDIEWIALSFVRSPKDLIELKKRIQLANKRSLVVAKIEKPEAMDNIDQIIARADAIMVARGDLGVEMPMEQVPVIQKAIVKKCIKIGKPVIIATQMMESMITNPGPTRAEANDVANSVLDGVDAVMLSGETSVGNFPELVIKAMSRIIETVENSNYDYSLTNAPDPKSANYLSDSVCYTACMLSAQTDARAIVAMTYSGYTPFQIASHRPKAMVYVFSQNKFILHILSLVWGVRCFYYDQYVSTDDTIHDVNEFLWQQKLVKRGDVVINTASIPIHQKRTTNMLTVSVIK